MRPKPQPCRFALPLGLLVLLAACAAQNQPPLMASVRGKAPVVSVLPTPVQPDAPDGEVAGSGTSSSSSVSAAEAALPSVIYFDADEYQVKESYRPMLQAYAKRLIADPDLHLRIDGHTDNTGPAHYNLELARVRAHMVMKQLVAMGVPAAQLQIVGHGMEKPRSKGAGTQAANRRVELSYR